MNDNVYTVYLEDLTPVEIDLSAIKENQTRIIEQNDTIIKKYDEIILKADKLIEIESNIYSVCWFCLAMLITVFLYRVLSSVMSF